MVDIYIMNNLMKLPKYSAGFERLSTKICCSSDLL